MLAALARTCHRNYRAIFSSRLLSHNTHLAHTHTHTHTHTLTHSHTLTLTHAHTLARTYTNMF